MSRYLKMLWHTRLAWHELKRPRGEKKTSPKWLETRKLQRERERESSHIRFLFFKSYRLLPPKSSKILSVNPTSSDHNRRSMRIRGRGVPPPPPDLPSTPPPFQLHHGNRQSVQSPGRNPSPPPPADDPRTSDLRGQTDCLILSEGEGVGAKKVSSKVQFF